MANDYFAKSGNPSANSLGDSSLIRAEITALEAAFDKLAGLTGNGDKIVVINAGGTAQTVKTAAELKTLLGLVIGTNVQAQDATLQSLSALGTAADKLAYTTGVDTWAEAILTSVARTLLAQTTQALMRTTGLGAGAIGDALFLAATAAAGRSTLGAAEDALVAHLAGTETITGAKTFTAIPQFNTLIDAAAGQIKFPATQNASADANTLDDYEEGTFTATITFSGGSAGMTYTVQTGKYIKISSLVYFATDVLFSAKGTSTGIARVVGFPFVPLNTVPSTGYVGYIDAVTFSGHPHCVASTVPNCFIIKQTTDAGVVSDLTDVNFSDTSRLMLSGAYVATS